MMPGSFTTEFAQLLTEVGWSPGECARRLNIGDSTIRNWQTGRRQPHQAVLVWLRDIRDRIDAGPRYPAGWERTESSCLASAS